jgi:ligand-binding SRPBCC domain-containing protein
MQVFSFDIASELKAAPEEIWRDVFDMEGVNAELAPYFSMSYPADTDWTKPVETGQVLFNSNISLFGVLPVDQHYLRFEHVEPGRGFHEYSYSIMNNLWEHKRTLEPTATGTLLRDEIRFSPQLTVLGWLLKGIYQSVFRHRHKRLRQRYNRD